MASKRILSQNLVEWLKEAALLTLAFGAFAFALYSLKCALIISVALAATITGIGYLFLGAVIHNDRTVGRTVVGGLTAILGLATYFAQAAYL